MSSVNSERTAPPPPEAPPTPPQQLPFEPLPEELIQVEAEGDVSSWLAFGDNGVSAHATAWGGLLQVRTYFPERKSVAVAELSETMNFNFKERLSLVNALTDAIPGLGLYPELGDATPVRQPIQWLFNRWPCVSYDFGSFHITVQLCVSQGFVVQRYSIDNHSSEEENIIFHFNPGIVLRSESPADADYDPKNNVIFGDSKGHYTVRNTACGAGLKFSLYHNGANLPLTSDFSDLDMPDPMARRRRRRLERRMRMRSSFSGYGYGVPSFPDTYGVSTAQSPTGCPSPLLGGKFRIPITANNPGPHEITAVYSLLELDVIDLTSSTTNTEKIGDPLPYISFDDILRGERRRRHLLEIEHDIPGDDLNTIGHPIYESKWPESLFLRHLEYILSVCAIPIVTTARGTLDTDASEDDEEHVRSERRYEKSPNVFSDDELAFVELFPAASSTSGFSGFFAFRFLLSMYLFLRGHTATTDIGTRAYYQGRIKNACTGHLKWVFETAKIDDGSWAATYLPNGEETLGSGSSFTAGSFNHLKLYEFLKVFPDQEYFVVNCLKRRTPDWLESLVKTRHKGKFWFDHTIELNIEFCDLDFREGYTLQAPKYKLTGLCLLWWALRSVDEIVTALRLREALPDLARQIEKALVNLDFFDMRKRIMDAFTVDTDPERSEPHRARPEAHNPSGIDNDPQPRRRQIETKGKTLVFSQRVLKEEPREICYCHDSFLFEAVALGFFQDETGKDISVWTESVSRQANKDIGKWDKTQRYSLALTMLKHCQSMGPGERNRKLEQCRRILRSAILESGAIATKFNPEGGPSWGLVDTVDPFQIPVILLWDECSKCSPLSLTLQKREGPLWTYGGDVSDRDDVVSVAATDREPQTPRPTLAPPTKAMARKKLAVRHANFDRKRINISPEVSCDWLYDYPDFIHFTPLVYDVREVSEELHPVGLFDEHIIPKLLETGSGDQDDNNDSGNDSDDDDARAIIVDCGMNRDPLTTRLWLGELQAYLKKPRVPEHAKKRLCYVDECTPTIAFVMCLAAPQRERQHLATFFLRHSQGSNSYQEWLHTLANIWESEFHLQYFQIVRSADVGKKDRDWILNVDEQEFPDPNKAGRRYLVQAATGYRFVGDLHDRFWTCHTVASIINPSAKWITRSAEHEGLLDTQDRHDQRNVFESYLIEKITEEACQGGDEILNEIDTMLDSNFGAAHMHNGDFESRYSLTSTFLQISAILRKLQGNHDSMLKAIAQWDRRQMERTTQPRWTEKDEMRCSERIAYHDRRGKRNTNRLKAHKERIDSLLNFTTTQREAVSESLQQRWVSFDRTNAFFRFWVTCN
ncbi:hypothetical protein FQN54_000475 [Arachnomyces sp. PD_36]|nr:hypothetical protein FQN54_000475 [Arachnomyces sp. PD_36]